MAKIAFICNPVFTYDKAGWSPLDTRLSGTEESIMQWAECLVNLGHDVKVFKNGPDTAHNGVLYLQREAYPTTWFDFDTTINMKSPDIKPKGHTYYFTNETDAGKLDLSGYKGVIWPSLWAKEHIKVNNPNVHVIPHGYDPTHIYPQSKVPKTVLYASSPDRGLDTLLEVWPEVVEAHPDAQLLVTYGAQPRDVPNTLFLGSVDEATMDELYRTTEIWCHPCNGGELFGITALKAQAAGCVPVYFPTMALRETVQAGIKTSPVALKDDLIRVLGDESLKEAVRQTLATKPFPTWESTAKELLALVLK